MSNTFPKNIYILPTFCSIQTTTTFQLIELNQYSGAIVYHKRLKEDFANDSNNSNRILSHLFTATSK